MDGMQNPQTVDNSATNDGTAAGQNPTGSDMTLAQAMGYDIDGSKPTADDGPAKDTPKAEEGSDPKNAEPKKPTWFDQLSDDIKGDEKIIKTLSKFNKVDDLAKSYTELQKLMGSRIELPKDDADADALNAFWQKVGKPKTAADYDLDGVEDTDKYRELAFNANLTVKQAKDVFLALREYGMNMMKNQQAMLKEMYTSTDNALREKYGNHYGIKKAMLEKGLKTWADEEASKALVSTGAIFNQSIAEMLIRMGEAASESGSTNRAVTGGRDGYVSRKDGGGFSINL